ncbi:hypothetical protein QRX60_16915 [Amycolatopsis mongoliensis]|uniref:Helix-turn-helix domain-containing protein n=1 Tax=Amycolatopsis mongoliensis TaxID=715475 RepID=A0A9Y2JWW2_9PSEU|nr:hypothetical protein [Amycolatopsis sp. 4-36]WIY05440.1 hypothetical protein QRX60_16915 [Amycolatopsis sp. 4-36]
MDQSPPGRRIFSPKMAAQSVGCHEKTILRALRLGELIGYQRAANCSWRIFEGDLLAWVRGERPVKARKSA